MRVTAEGKVGIGTPNPAFPLEVRTPLNVNADGIAHTDGNVTVSTSIGAGGTPSTRGWIGTKSNHPFTLFTNNTPQATVDSDGDVGIGTTFPQAKLEVKSPFVGTDDNALIVTDSNAVPVFAVTASGKVRYAADHATSTTHVCLNSRFLAACSSAAEYVPAIDTGLGAAEAGQLVRLAPGVQNPFGDEHAPFVVSKASSACDPNLLGFIVNPESGADGKKVNDAYLPLAIYGYFPAKVTMEGGPIRRGDAITSSSTPGAGMKATGACRTIGFALDDADADGTIQVFSNLGDSSAGEVNALRGRIETLEAQLQQAIGPQGIAYHVEDSTTTTTGPVEQIAALEQQNADLAARLSASEQQNASLESRLTALEQAGVTPSLTGIVSMNEGWPLLALVVMAGIAVVIRRRATR
jgi:hypothetical protein